MTEIPAHSTIRQWRHDPIKFAWDVFRVELDDWQTECLRAWGDHSIPKLRIAEVACAGPGKTLCLGIMGWHGMTCFADIGGHPKGAAFSINRDNLRDNLWAEMAGLRRKSPFLMQAFEWTNSRIYAKDHPDTWFMTARAFPKTANNEELGRTLSGLHAPYVFILGDETGDIPIQVLKAGEQAFSSTRTKFGRIAIAGNPTSHQGMLYAASQRPDEWVIVRITGDPDDPKRSPRIDIGWAREKIAQYGREDPWVMAYILGLFPPVSINQLLGPDEVYAATQRVYRESQIEFQQKRLGIDVGAEIDRTVIFPRQGLVAHKPVTMRGAKTHQISGQIAAIKSQWHSEVEFVDNTGGWGAGVVDDLEMAGYGPTPINFSSKASDPRYFNIRSEMWWRMAEWIKRGGAIPKSGTLQRELMAPTYWMDKGRLRLEEKEQIKKRLGFSPDEADALALTFAEVELPSSRHIDGDQHFAGKGGVVKEIDPFAGDEDGL